MVSIVDELDPLFNPKGVAVIGASNDWNKWGNSAFASLLHRYQGPIYPINNREPEIMGHQAYRSVLEVQDAIDLAVFVIPAERVPQAMQECVDKGVKAGIVISAGFRETGAEGRALEDEVLAIARSGNLRFVGPNCMGLWSATSNLSAYMFALPSQDGPVAFVTQGGNVGGALVSSAYNRGLGIRRYVSCGPAADIQLEDYLEYFGADDGVKVIMAYIEGLNDGQRFLEKAAKVSLKKPIVVYKPGRSEAVANAIRSHSGSLAGSDEIFEAAMKKAGIVRVQSPEELLDVATGFLTQPLPKGRNVGIITGGGSYGVICAEDCAAAGLEVPTLPESTIAELSRLFPPRWSHGNPVDPAGDRNFIAYYLAPKIILDIPDIDALIFMGFGSVAGFANFIDQNEGSQFFINRIPQMLSQVQGLDQIKQGAIALLQTGDMALIRSLYEPFLPYLTAAFGSDEPTIRAFIEILHATDEIRGDMAALLETLPVDRDDPRAILPPLLEFFEGMIGVLLAHFMKTFKKPVISTTFQEVTQQIKGSSYAFSTSAKAVKVLARLVEYREFLEHQGALRDPLQACALLKE